ncbi:nucleoside-diphosphate-sugar pyrophosphorylase [Desulfosarcina ovata subsp. sediminis]|uniref:Nucleoside-diphosphate-sugar pyrophosphorylase n=1 Tax=Desulfosarcina ovata subsp. sediminis TaxID=885957 RepID=A0A5K7ZFM7_9BACT|nr:nucleoside-diphosphate-sugar pyrophosphorylase [Desulfosarcina ovata subsp. sediminis]
MRSAVDDRNKVAASVNGRPFISYLLDRLDSSGFQEVIICSGHKGDDLLERMGNCYKRLKLTYSKEPTALGTAGALRFAEHLISSEEALILNGDSYCDIELDKLIDYHRAKKNAATLVAVWVPDTGRYGAVKIDNGEKIIAFSEKRGVGHPGYVNAGIYIIKKAFFGSIPEGRPVSLEREIFPQWISQGLAVFRHNGGFIDIGTPESYAEAQSYLTELGEDAMAGQVNTK